MSPGSKPLDMVWPVPRLRVEYGRMDQARLDRKAIPGNNRLGEIIDDWKQSGMGLGSLFSCFAFYFLSSLCYVS